MWLGEPGKLTPAYRNCLTFSSFLGTCNCPFLIICNRKSETAHNVNKKYIAYLLLP
jgi:hypothetical protein